MPAADRNLTNMNNLCFRCLSGIVVSSSIVAVAASNAHAESLTPNPSGIGNCERIYAESVSKVSQLRDVLDRCEFNTDAYALALFKLNHLPPPQGIPKLSLQQRSTVAPVSRARYEAEIFFNLFETYPPVPAFARLDKLIDKVSEGFDIERIEIDGSCDRHECELVEMKLATRRADFVKTYLIAAGVDPARIHNEPRDPSHANTPEGRALDRVASVKVLVLRNASSEVLAQKLPDPFLPEIDLLNAAPIYPPEAKQYGQQGRVMVKVRIEIDGTPSNGEVSQSSGYPLLDAAALQAVQGWHYRPGRRGGVPEAMWVNMPIIFVMDR
jgi:TonB family protein